MHRICSYAAGAAVMATVVIAACVGAPDAPGTCRCADDQVCVDGQCRTPCAGADDCDSGYVCEEGACVSRPCTGVGDCDDQNGCTLDQCLAGRCDFSNTACFGATPACDLGAKQCVQCTERGHCGGATPACDTALHQCVACVADGDCGGATPYCSGTTCVECREPSHCDDQNDCTVNDCVAARCDFSSSACTGVTPYCSGTRCVECTGQSHCNDGSSCTLDQCLDGSCDYATTSCGGATPYCAGDTCVECTGAAHCNDNNGCTLDQCLDHTCDHATSACGGATPYCSGTTCVQCTGNPHCGGATPYCVDNVCRQCAAPSQCDDSNACTVNDCINNTCDFSAFACSSTTPYCSGTTCVECTSNPHCSGSTPYCVGNVCRECSISSQCSDGNECTYDACDSYVCDNPTVPGGTTCTNGTCPVGHLCLPGAPTCAGTVCTLPYCFVAGTPVHTRSGLRAIETIEVGDEVATYDEQHGVIRFAKVAAAQMREAAGLAVVEVEGGERIVSTTDHPYFVSGAGWVRAEELRAGESLRDAAGRPVGLQSVELRPDARAQVYNLVVGPTKSYFVGRQGVLVHSCDTTVNLGDGAPRRAPASAREGSGAWLLALGSLPGAFALVEDPGRPDSAVRPLPCLSVGPWARRIGVIDDHLLVLDAEARALRVIPLAALRQIRDGRRACSVGDVIGTTLVLPETPYTGVLVGEELFVTYFATNRLERYRWHNGRLVPLGARVVATATTMGLSDVRLVGDTLYATDVGWQCRGGNNCGENYGTSSLLALRRDRDLPIRAVAANKNSAALHLQGGELFLLNTGHLPGGYGSIQRVLAPDQLGPELVLPRNARPFRGVSLVADLFAVLQLSGDHLFIVDAARLQLQSILRFDGARFAPIPPWSAALRERADADLQDLLAVPGRPGHFLLIDSKNERLVHVRFVAAGASFAVVGVTDLWRPEGRTTPSWGVWLDAP